MMKTFQNIQSTQTLLETMLLQHFLKETLEFKYLYVIEEVTLLLMYSLTRMKISHVNF